MLGDEGGHDEVAADINGRPTHVEQPIDPEEQPDTLGRNADQG